MGVFVHAAGDVPFVQKTLFRNLIAFFVALTMLLIKGRKDPSVIKIPRGSLKYLLLRSIFGSIGIFGNFYALDRLNIADAAMLNKMSPFFSLLLSMFILGEKPTLASVLSIALAFAGALFVIKPSMDFSHVIPALAGFAGGMGAGFAYACVRKCHTYNVQGFLIIAFFSAFSLLCALPSTILFYSPMTSRQFLFLLAAGLAAAGGQLGITGAYFNAPSSKISIYEYTQIIFSALLGFFLFEQLPDALSLLGYTVIIGTAVFSFLRSRRS